MRRAFLTAVIKAMQNIVVPFHVGTTSFTPSYTFGTSFTVSNTCTLVGLQVGTTSPATGGTGTLTVDIWDNTSQAIIASGSLNTTYAGNSHYVINFDAPVTLQPNTNYTLSVYGTGTVNIGGTNPVFPHTHNGAEVMFDVIGGSRNTTTGSGPLYPNLSYTYELELSPVVQFAGSGTPIAVGPSVVTATGTAFSAKGVSIEASNPATASGVLKSIAAHFTGAGPIWFATGTLSGTTYTVRDATGQISAATGLGFYDVNLNIQAGDYIACYTNQTGGAIIGGVSGGSTVYYNTGVTTVPAAGVAYTGLSSMSQQLELAGV